MQPLRYADMEPYQKIAPRIAARGLLYIEQMLADAYLMNFSAIEPSTLLGLATYGGALGFYLLVAPLAIMYYLKLRFYEAGSVERLGLYGLVLVFFPGMLILSPFLNFRPKRREI